MRVRQKNTKVKFGASSFLCLYHMFHESIFNSISSVIPLNGCIVPLGRNGYMAVGQFEINCVSNKHFLAPVNTKPLHIWFLLPEIMSK